MGDNKFLSSIKCFLLDMDGTVYLSDTPIAGAVDAVRRMQSRARVIFVTNNSSTTRDMYHKKLTRIGFCLSVDDIYGSGNATIDYLLCSHKGKKVYLLGTDGLRQEFLASGINFCGDSGDTHAEVAVLSFDKTLTYQKLEVFCRLVRGGAFYVATHPDKTCPILDGSIPDVGSFIRLIRCATGRLPDMICGKPSKQYGRRILAKTGLMPNQIAMVGDRLSTDMRFAYNCGFRSVLVLSGEARRQDLDGQRRQPDLVIDSISDWDK